MHKIILLPSIGDILNLMKYGIYFYSSFLGGLDYHRIPAFPKGSLTERKQMEQSRLSMEANRAAIRCYVTILGNCTGYCSGGRGTGLKGSGASFPHGELRPS